MNGERKAKFNQLRKQLASLSEDQKLQLMVSAGGITNVDGHTLSLSNTVLMMMQAGNTTPTVVGGYRQWQRAGRQVQKGQHGLMIWYPSRRVQDEDEDADEDLKFFVGTVFDISQTEVRSTQ